MTIEILPQRFTVCKVREISETQLAAQFCFVGKTDQELSLVCETTDAPEQFLAREDGWRGIRIVGPLDFSLVGILSKISGILAEEKIGIFAVSTYDTDYILVKEPQLEQAAEALRRHGYAVQNMDLDRKW